MGLGQFKREDTETSTNGYEKKLKPKEEPEWGREDSTYAVGPPLSEIGGGAKLQERMKNCDTIEDWSFLLNDYIKWGNNSKVGSTVGIFNLGSGHDCVNRWTDRCQVGGDQCYTVRNEKQYEYALDFFRRQEYLWDCIDAETWLRAFDEILSRKRKEVNAFKFSQAGDVRNTSDLIKINRIAEGLNKHNIPVFIYSASSHLDWDYVDSDNITVLESNDSGFGDKRYKTFPTSSDIPDDYVWCSYNKDKENGVSKKERTKCGECTLCVEKDAPDIAVVLSE